MINLDGGTPPPELARQKKIRDAALNTEEAAQEFASSVVIDENTLPHELNKPTNINPVTVPEKYAAVATIPEGYTASPTAPVKKPANIKVTIENDFIKYDFWAVDVAENDFSLAFFIEENAFNITPKQDSEFDLMHNGLPYKVFHTGNPFYFKELNLHLLVFIKKNDQASNS